MVSGWLAVCCYYCTRHLYYEGFPNNTNVPPYFTSLLAIFGSLLHQNSCKVARVPVSGIRGDFEAWVASCFYFPFSNGVYGRLEAYLLSADYPGQCQCPFTFLCSFSGTVAMHQAGEEYNMIKN